MRFKITAGADIETATPKEVRDEIGRGNQDWFREMARGMKPVRFFTDGIISAAAISLPGTSGDQVGPRPGFCWAVQRISVFGLSTNDVMDVHRNSSSDRANFIGRIPATSPTLFPGSSGLVLTATETLVFEGTIPTATGQITINGEAIEVPEFMAWKLL